MNQILHTHKKEEEKKVSYLLEKKNTRKQCRLSDHLDHTEVNIKIFTRSMPCIVVVG